MPAEVKRSLRVASRLARELSAVIARTVRDPRVASVTITRVDMPDDLRRARVFFRLIEGGESPERRGQALKGLARATGMLRKEVSQRLGLRYAPELEFVFDDGQDQVTTIERLLHEVKQEELGKKR